MDWKDGLTAAAIVGVGLFGVKTIRERNYRNHLVNKFGAESYCHNHKTCGGYRVEGGFLCWPCRDIEADIRIAKRNEAESFSAESKCEHKNWSIYDYVREGSHSRYGFQKGSPKLRGQNATAQIICTDCGDHFALLRFDYDGVGRLPSAWFVAESFSADEDMLPVGTLVRSYDFGFPAGDGDKPTVDISCYKEGIIEKIAPSPRCSPNCMHYHIKATKTVWAGKEDKDWLDDFMTHPSPNIRSVAEWDSMNGVEDAEVEFYTRKGGQVYQSTPFGLDEFSAESFAVDVIHRKDGKEVGHWTDANEYECGECGSVYDGSSDATICCKCPSCDDPIHEGDCIKYAESFSADADWVIKDENYSHWDFTGTEAEAKEYAKNKKLVGWGLFTEVEKGKWLVITQDERGYEYEGDVDGDKNLAKQEEPLKYIDTWPYGAESFSAEKCANCEKLEKKNEILFEEAYSLFEYDSGAYDDYMKRLHDEGVCDGKDEAGFYPCFYCHQIDHPNEDWDAESFSAEQKCGNCGMMKDVLNMMPSGDTCRGCFESWSKEKQAGYGAENFNAESEECYVCDKFFNQVYVCDGCGFQCCEVDIDGNLIPVHNDDGTINDYCITCYEEQKKAESFSAETSRFNEKLWRKEYTTEGDFVDLMEIKKGTGRGLVLLRNRNGIVDGPSYWDSSPPAIEWIEDILGNSDWELTTADQLGALSEAPVLAKGHYDDEGNFVLNSNVAYYFGNYQIEDWGEVLDREGEVFFHRASFSKAAESHAYSYAYNEGHSDSRKREEYRPNLTTARQEGDFKKILKQKGD